MSFFACLYECIGRAIALPVAVALALALTLQAAAVSALAGKGTTLYVDRSCYCCIMFFLVIIAVIRDLFVLGYIDGVYSQRYKVPQLP